MFADPATPSSGASTPPAARHRARRAPRTQCGARPCSCSHASSNSFRRGAFSRTKRRTLVRGRASRRAGVVYLGTRPRTQNGHIRNDTRDASRRIPDAWIGPICRRNCVADDRACTRVTPRNLHGKEGVGGSSPPGGSAKAPQTGVFCSAELAEPPVCGGSGAPLWSPQVLSGRSKRRKMTVFSGVGRAASRLLAPSDGALSPGGGTVDG
jgi:hypothetical protein